MVAIRPTHRRQGYSRKIAGRHFPRGALEIRCIGPGGKPRRSAYEDDDTATTRAGGRTVSTADPAAQLTAPHCDEMVLHKPGECDHCDANPDWQELRKLWGIAFTGHAPTERQMWCPSDYRRGLGAAHVWGGNRPTHVDPPQEQSFASKVMYGWRKK